MTEINYVRNLSGGGRANPCRPCEPMLAQPTGRSLYRGRVLWFLRHLSH